MTLVLGHEASDPGQDRVAIPLMDWLTAQDLDPHVIYRVEIHVVDAPMIRVFEFLHNADGRLYCPRDHDHPYSYPGCDVARRDPYDVLLTVDPPWELLRLHDVQWPVQPLKDDR